MITKEQVREILEKVRTRSYFYLNRYPLSEKMTPKQAVDVTLTSIDELLEEIPEGSEESINTRVRVTLGLDYGEEQRLMLREYERTQADEQ